MLPSSVQVAIVGAGPVGLAAACVLQARGVDVVVLDANQAGANTSRAAVVHARTLEVLEQLGVTQSLLQAGVVVPEFTVRDGHSVLARLDFRGLPTAYPFTLMVPQSTTEQLLLERLQQLGGNVHRGCRVEDLQPDGAGALLQVRTGEGCPVEQLHATYVIGADGVRSVVREASGFKYEGASYDESFVLADIELDWPLPRDEVQLFFAASGLVVVAPLPGGRHRVVATVRNAPAQPTSADVQALLEERGPAQSRVRRIVWSSRFRLQHRLADTYRRGPVFLAGDAAHAHSPAGGQGMNTGIQDAVDLGNTLASVIQGEADVATLDEYTDRRRPVARQVVHFTDRMTRAATLRNPLARSIRNGAVRVITSYSPARHGLARQLAELPRTR